MKRAEFLARVSARLGRPATDVAWQSPVPGQPRQPGQRGHARAAVPERAVLAARFAAELERVGGSVQPCASSAELAELLARFLRDSGARRAVGFELAACGLQGVPGLADLWRAFPVVTPFAGAGFRAAAAAADVGLSLGDLGVAASGSLLFLAAPERPRAVTLLPRSHVAILCASTLVPDLAGACAELAARGAQASSALFVTGPSRTSDIENDLTLGVHGPAAVTVFLLDD